MNKASIYSLFLLYISFFLLQACDDNDGYSLGNVYITMATVERTTEQGTPYFVWDNGSAVWVAATAVPYKHLNTGQRVLGSFTLLSDRGDFFDHYVRLNDFRKVLTKEVIDLTEVNEEEIGDDPVSITNMWLDNDYLNVQFVMVIPREEKHLVNLVYNTIELPDDSDGYLHLEYRYNNMGDTDGYTVRSIVSFKLNTFTNNGEDIPKGVKVRINSVVNGATVITLDYPSAYDSASRDYADDLSSEEIQ